MEYIRWNYKNLKILINNNISIHDHYHYEAELLYIIEGEYRVRSRSQNYLLKSGDIFFTFPFDQHGYENIGKISAFIAIFPPDFTQAYSNILMTERPVSPLIDISQFHAGFGDTLVRLAGLTAHGAGEEIIGNYLTAAVGELLKVMTLEKRSKSQKNSLDKIIRHCIENFDDPSFSLEILSQMINLNRSTISHIMSKYIGVGFSKFVNSLRINRARELLRRDKLSITDIAYECGFESQRTFNRVFQDFTGMTPSILRKNKQNNRM